MTVERNREAQRALYGEPLGSLFSDVAQRLGLTQSRIAGVLGISAPMLSQLMSAQRAKIGNPAAAARLQELLALSARAGDLTADEQAAALEEIAQSNAPVTSAVQRVTGVMESGAEGAAYRVVQDLFRDVASAADYLAVAALIAEQHPQIAELLTVYGAGRTADAREHYERTRS